MLCYGGHHLLELLWLVFFISASFDLQLPSNLKNILFPWSMTDLQPKFGVGCHQWLNFEFEHERVVETLVKQQALSSLIFWILTYIWTLIVLNFWRLIRMALDDLELKLEDEDPLMSRNRDPHQPLIIGWFWLQMTLKPSNFLPWACL